ncbi:MAG: P-II family nitrogen regulator [Vampirovibrionales bacterium]|nr:P-II family nitrogen regulator [Vampirovibrionales bacterium]
MPVSKLNKYKRIEVLVNEVQLEGLKQALDPTTCALMEITPVKVRSEQGGLQLEWRAGTYTIDFLHKAKLTLVVPAELTDRVMNQILTACRGQATTEATHALEAGYVLVSDLEQVVVFGSN